MGTVDELLPGLVCPAIQMESSWQTPVQTLKLRDWPLARVEQVHPGDDGEIRAVTLRCRGRTFTRPTCKVIPLQDPTR